MYIGRHWLGSDTDWNVYIINVMAGALIWLLIVKMEQGYLEFLLCKIIIEKVLVNIFLVQYLLQNITKQQCMLQSMSHAPINVTCSNQCYKGQYYAPVQVNPRGMPPRLPTGIWQAYIWQYRGLWQQQFFPILLWHHSDITNGRNIDLLGGDSDSNSSWQGDDSDWWTVSPSEFLGSAWGCPYDSFWQVH